MRVAQAKQVARRWVSEQASAFPNFAGAFFHGSTNWLAADADLPATSDVDVMVVLDDPDPPAKLGKLVYEGVLLDVSYLARDQLRSAEFVLGQYHLAGSFRTPSIIADPSGRLTSLQAAVANDYAKRDWVVRRCAHARDKALHAYQLLESDPLHDQVSAWLFPAGITTHVLLAAGLRNPTVRRRYLAVRELLAEYGRADFYPCLLELLGCAQMSRARAEQHLTALADAFDAAGATITTPFEFASDLSPVARPLAIDGSREMIERGDHREAVFWMVATYSRCQKVLYYDAPVELQERFTNGYHRLLADLGIASFTDLRQRREQVARCMPRVWDVAQAIMAANPDMEDSP